MNFILIYLLFINLIVFIFMGLDKRKAINHSFRIPEKFLLSLSFLGGSLGCALGMIFFHHKTKKMKFNILIPIFLFIHISLFFLKLAL